MIKKDSDILESMKGKSNPFILPDDYFDNFASEMESKIKKETKMVQLKSSYNRIKPWAYVAAAVAMLMFCVQLYISNQETLEANKKTEINNVDSELLYTHLDDESIMDYLISSSEEE